MDNQEVDVSSLPKSPRGIVFAEAEDYQMNQAFMLTLLSLFVTCFFGFSAYSSGWQSSGGAFAISLVFTVVLFSYYMFLDNKKSALFAKQLGQFIDSNQFSATAVLSIDQDSQPFVYGLGDRYSSYLSFGGKINSYNFRTYNYNYYVKGKNSETCHPFTIMHIKLDKQLPHIVLDSRKNDGLISSIPKYFDDKQRISLEGDFDKYFDLFGPLEYEIETLDILSPDFMQMLMQFHTDFDVEIDGDNAYIIAKGVKYDQKSMSELFLAANELTKKFNHKLKAWSMAAMSKQLPELVAHKGESAVRIGNKRVTTSYFIIPLVAGYVAFEVMNLGFFGIEVVAGAVVVTVALMLLARRGRKSRT